MVRLYGVEELDRRVDAVLETVDLSGRAGDLVRTLSRGLQQRASVARAILHRPKVLLLDEPETGLDDAAQLRLVVCWPNGPGGKAGFSLRLTDSNGPKRSAIGSWCSGTARLSTR